VLIYQESVLNYQESVLNHQESGLNFQEGVHFCHEAGKFTKEQAFMS